MTTDEPQPTPTAAAPQGVKTELKTMSLSNLSNGQDGGRSKPAPLRKEPGCGRTKPAPMREEPGCFRRRMNLRPACKKPPAATGPAFAAIRPFSIKCLAVARIVRRDLPPTAASSPPPRIPPRSGARRDIISSTSPCPARSSYAAKPASCCVLLHCAIVTHECTPINTNFRLRPFVQIRVDSWAKSHDRIRLLAEPG